MGRNAPADSLHFSKPPTGPPLSSVPPGAPLYVVEFKAGRAETLGRKLTLLKEKGRVRQRGGKKHKERMIEQAAARADVVAVTKKQKKQKTKVNRTRTNRLAQIPLSALVQITSYLAPLDILFLARTAKRWRKLLMSRSSTYIWRAAIANVEDLPPCPDTMNEPQYTALVFTLLCTFCRKKMTTEYDTLYTNLLVRLCNHCKRANLVDWWGIPSTGIRALVTHSKSERYCLRSEVEEVMDWVSELEESGDEDALDSWMVERRALLRERYEHGWQLAQFVAGQQSDHKKVRKTSRHHEIKRRLKVLGWSDEDMVFPPETERRWLQQLHHDCPLTDRHWEKIRPALEGLLETNVRERPARQSLERQKERRARLRLVWDTVKVGMARPVAGSTVPRSLAEAVSQVAAFKPIPEFSDAVDWPTIKTLIETDIPVTELDDHLLQQRGEIDREASEWCGLIQISLAGVLRRNLTQNGCSTGFPIVGTITQNQHCDPFAELSPELQVCIRADSLFFSNQSACYAVRPLSSYDDYIKEIRRSVYGRDRRVLEPLDVDQFHCHTEASIVTRALLKYLGRPANTSILELRLLNERFSCGRCDDNKPKSWLQMVEHYTKEAASWKILRVNYKRRFDDMNVAIRNIHDFESSSKPLMTVLTPRELSSLEDMPASPGGMESGLFKCGFCLDAFISHEPKTGTQMLNHLVDFHAITEPQLEGPSVELWQPANR
ncbi:hypothetical protein BDV93DRAFT_607449 [Ceratobasidium sp. AG-I]|nr:hypothetical protein BDV93DRAFT_607449 [Ceratobasidium sp. AG-I]